MHPDDMYRGSAAGRGGWLLQDGHCTSSRWGMKTPPPRLCALAAVGGGALLLAQPAGGFLISPPRSATSVESNFLPGAVPFASHPKRATATTAPRRISHHASGGPITSSGGLPMQRFPRVVGTMMSDSDGSGGIVSAWRKLAAGFAVGLTIFAGGVLMPAPGDGVGAAMAPSLMQDEKGYISIFEKVRVCECLV